MIYAVASKRFSHTLSSIARTANKYQTMCQVFAFKGLKTMEIYEKS